MQNFGKQPNVYLFNHALFNRAEILLFLIEISFEINMILVVSTVSFLFMDFIILLNIIEYANKKWNAVIFYNQNEMQTAFQKLVFVLVFVA